MTAETYGKHLLFREAVADQFHRAGILNAAASRPLKPSERINAAPVGHVRGLRDFEVVVQASVRARPSEGLDEAQEAARAAGKPFAAVIMDRPARSLRESYVILALDQFAQLVAQYESDADQDSKT